MRMKLPRTHFGLGYHITEGTVSLGITGRECSLNDFSKTHTGPLPNKDGKVIQRTTIKTTFPASLAEVMQKKWSFPFRPLGHHTRMRFCEV